MKKPSNTCLEKAVTGREVDEDSWEELGNLCSVIEFSLLIGQGKVGEEVAWLMVTAIPSLLKVPFAAVGLKKAEDGKWLVVGQRDKQHLNATVAQEIASLLAAGLASRAFSSAAFLLPADFPGAPVPVPEPLAKLGLKSVLVVPVRTIAHEFGVLIVGSEVGENYTSHQRFLIGSLANQVAVALENARLIEQAEELEERYRSTLDNMLEGCHIIGYDWRFLYVNDAAARHWRQAKEELLGHTMMEGHPGIEHTEVFAALQRCMEKRIPHRREDELTFPDSSKGWFYLSIQPVPEGIFVLSQEITERKEAEEALRESEHKYRALFDSTLDGAFVIDAETMKVVLCNEAAAKIYGFDSVEDGIGTNPLDFVPPDDRERVISIIAEDMFEKDLHQVNEFRTMTKDGREIWISAIGVRTEYQGRLAGLVSFRDITERKRAAEEIAKFKTISDKAGYGITIVDLEGNSNYINESFANMHGYTPDEVIGKHLSIFHTAQQMAHVNRILEQLNREGSYVAEEVWHVRKDGAVFPTLMNGTLVRDEKGGPLFMAGTAVDITERKRAEEALRENEERFRSLVNDVLDSAAVGMFILDRDFRVVWVNRALQRYFDIRREQALGKDKRELIGERIKHIFEDSETFAQKVLATYDDNTYIENFECHVLPKGRRKERWLEHWSQPIKSGLYAGGRIEHYYDITERKQAEERLTRLSRALEMATDSIVISDINARIIDVNEATLKMYGTADREELVGKSSFALIAPEDHERALASLKQTLEKGYIEGQEYHAITEHGIRILAETNCGIMKDAHGKVTGFVATSRDITERKQAEERLRQSWEQLRRVLEETVDALASLVEKRDPYTAGHQQRVTKLACAIAEEMGLPEEQIKGIRVAGTIHDVGKIYVPAEILSKPGKLTDYEFAIIKTHPQVGYEIVEGIEFPWPVAQAVLQHHERLDGSGYPAGLSGEEIILEARILAVSDVVEAMSSHRPFRPALGTDKALEEISQNSGILYDPDVVNACLKLFNEKGFRFE